MFFFITDRAFFRHALETLAHEKKQCYNIPKRILQAANVSGRHTQEIQTETISAGRETYDTP